MNEGITRENNNRYIAQEIIEYFLDNSSVSRTEVIGFLRSRTDPEWAEEFFRALLAHGIIEETTLKFTLPGRIGGMWSIYYQIGPIDEALRNISYTSIGLSK